LSGKSYDTELGFGRTRIHFPDYQRLGLAIALLMLAALPLRAQSLAIDPSTVGAPGSGARAELYLPAGGAPTAAVVVLHGCNGVSPHYRIWAARLAQWGYAALLIDSFRPRGYPDGVCNHGRDVPAEVRARDAFAGAAYLRSRPELRNARIGLIGFSHGGWTVLKTVLAGARQAGETPFAAAVAFYPGCFAADTPLETDTLILIGDADDWSSTERCLRWREQVQANGHALQMKVYPGALHGFDAEAPPHYFVGHHVGREPAAAEDAVAQTQAFFAARLGAAR
jgi:dienelactone hydrolase